MSDSEPETFFCTEHGDFSNKGNFHVCAGCYKETKNKVEKLEAENKKLKQDNAEFRNQIRAIRNVIKARSELTFKEFIEKLVRILRG